MTAANNPLAWADHGLCAGADPEVFYPTMTMGRGPAGRDLAATDDQLAAARTYCDTCPVRAACHEWAVHHERFGIWAGTDPRARQALRKALGVALVVPDPDVVTGLIPDVDEMTGGGSRQPSSPTPSA